MKNVLIVSPYYPPGPTACAHRARHLAKHLHRYGWNPVVLCVDENCLEEKLDYGLLRLVSDAAEVIKCGALPARFVRPLGVGEVTLRAWFSMRSRINYLLRSRKFDVVMFTGSHFYSMLHAPFVRDRFGIPVLLDFQDPWVSKWSAKQPRFSKAGAAHWLATMLEPKAIAAADFVTAVSQIQNAEMCERYPWLDPSRMAAIPIGGDPDDYDALRTTEPDGHDFTLDSSRINFSYVGTIWPPVMPTVHTLLRAVAEVRSRRPDIYTRLSLNFIGTTKSLDAPDGRWVQPLAETMGLAGIVREVPNRLPYLEALSLQARSDAILVLGSAEPHYTASKIYGVLMSGRPFLSVFHSASSSYDILARAGGGVTLCFENSDALSGLVGRLADAIVLLATAPDMIGRSNPAVYDPFTARAIAREYATIFDRLQSRQASREPSCVVPDPLHMAHSEYHHHVLHDPR